MATAYVGEKDMAFGHSEGSYSHHLGLMAGDASHRGPTDDMMAYEPEHVLDDDDSISVLDPRRLTSTLHASLVSEILSLRRELDSKHQFIESLEAGFQTVKVENESVLHKLSDTSKDNRSMKRQLQQLESGSRFALDELERDRDEASQAIEDLKDKVGLLQKKIRVQEDDAGRAHALGEKDRESWAAEKRALERRVHVSETRLKTVLNELAAQQAADRAHEHHEWESGGGKEHGGPGYDSDATSVRSLSRKGSLSRSRRHVRNMSSNSTHKSLRFSVLSGTGSDGHGVVNGLSLADELGFDEEDEDVDDLPNDEDEYPEHEIPARRALESRQSTRQDDKAKRVLGLTVEAKTPRTGEVSEIHVLYPEQEADENQDEDLPPLRNEVEYVDAGIQYSPPPSPKLPPAKPPPAEKIVEPVPLQVDVEANQRRKRVTPSSVGHILSQLVAANAKAVPPSAVSVSSPKDGGPPPSPPETPATAKVSSFGIRECYHCRFLPRPQCLRFRLRRMLLPSNRKPFPKRRQSCRHPPHRFRFQPSRYTRLCLRRPLQRSPSSHPGPRMPSAKPTSRPRPVPSRSRRRRFASTNGR